MLALNRISCLPMILQVGDVVWLQQQGLSLCLQSPGSSDLTLCLAAGPGSRKVMEVTGHMLFSATYSPWLVWRERPRISRAREGKLPWARVFFNSLSSIY